MKYYPSKEGQILKIVSPKLPKNLNLINAFPKSTGKP